MYVRYAFQVCRIGQLGLPGINQADGKGVPVLAILTSDIYNIHITFYAEQAFPHPESQFNLSPSADVIL